MAGMPAGLPKSEELNPPADSAWHYLPPRFEALGLPLFN
jgi:hypothetical protein